MSTDFLKRERNLLAAGHRPSFRPAVIRRLATALRRGRSIPVFRRRIDNIVVEADVDRQLEACTRRRYQRYRQLSQEVRE